MAWSTPPTWVAGQVITAAQLNILRDCLLETAVAKATAANGYYVATGPNTLAERFMSEAIVDASETTTSTSYTSLATNGPVLSSITTGTKALVWVTSQSSNSTTASSAATYEVTGSTTIAAADSWAAIVDANAANAVRSSAVSLVALTAGTNTFRMLYRVSSGASTGTFHRRRILVQPL